MAVDYRKENLVCAAALVLFADSSQFSAASHRTR
jgi:hypothetical protein